jgi:hypothetical protein
MMMEKNCTDAYKAHADNCMCSCQRCGLRITRHHPNAGGHCLIAFTDAEIEAAIVALRKEKAN